MMGAANVSPPKAGLLERYITTAVLAPLGLTAVSTTTAVQRVTAWQPVGWTTIRLDVNHLKVVISFMVCVICVAFTLHFC